MLATATSSTHTYRSASSEINFFSDDQEGLSVTIDTARLHIRSVESKEVEYNNYTALFGDKTVMEKFADGEIMPAEKIRARINDIWVKRWREKSPYAGLAIFKKDTDDFVGHIVLGHKPEGGTSELVYLLHAHQWGKGYGSEAATAVVREYAPATVQEGYILRGKPLEAIVATVRPDNTASIRILEKVGMHFTHTEEKYGALRHYYSIKLSEISKMPDNKT